MSTGLVTLFGGSGFIGHYAARALVEAGYRVRIAVRRPHLAGDVRHTDLWSSCAGSFESCTTSRFGE